MAFRELPVDTLSKTFLTLQKVMEESIRVDGGNEYKLPHMKKDKLIKNLSTYNVECSQECYESALGKLAERLEAEQELRARLEGDGDS